MGGDQGRDALAADHTDHQGVLGQGGDLPAGRHDPPGVRPVEPAAQPVRGGDAM
ncbi:hypothetical protein ACGF0J_22220 [Nonomuraea sp. NPDC047897]|uniref:hypothetical protein n=1 Tax=Nonomuraea sp. NPDC047897 TaxID=3364346 RepID=UPI00371A9FB9